MSVPFIQPPSMSRHGASQPDVPQYPPYPRAEMHRATSYPAPMGELRGGPPPPPGYQQQQPHYLPSAPPPLMSDTRRYYIDDPAMYADLRRSAPLPMDAHGNPLSNPKKRSRDELESLPPQNSTKRSPLSPNRPRAGSTGRSKNGHSANGAAPPTATGSGGNGPASADSPSSNLPAVLTREKKQKACANCRRAKLKCIVEHGEADCVRCRARQERCVFYPRTHDEDWQQTMTNDVYRAINHLSHLSEAVHHILFHLTARNVIPPLRLNETGQGLEVFEAPERDMALLQGWGAEKNRDLGDEPKKRGKRRGSDNQQPLESWEEADFRAEPEREQPPVDSHTEPPPMPSYLSVISHPRPSSMSVDRLPPNGWDPHGMSASSSSRSSQTQLPPFRPQGHPGTIQLTPTSELGIAAPSFSGYVPVQAAPPMTALPPPPHPPPPSAPVFGPEQAIASTSISPNGPPNVTPNSLVSSSPVVEASGLLSAGLDGSFSAPDGGMMVLQGNDDPQTVLGSADPRMDIIKKGMIDKHDATTLVSYFHRHMSPLLFGYQLQLGRFPYLPEGPKVMTPFILGVECLLASERVPHLSTYHSILADEVKELLMKSPAESWQSLQDAAQDTDSQGDDRLDPELGIGPEEIVAACVLSIWMSERPEASTIATSAFNWARGWINILTQDTVQPRFTLACAAGFVPEERKATAQDMARIWLLCFIVDGTEAIQRSAPPPPSRDPLKYCADLVPLDHDGRDKCEPSDVLLVHHAKLVNHLREWHSRRLTIHMSGASQSDQAAQYRRLALRTSNLLDLWRESLDLYGLDGVMTRQIDVFYLFARVLVHANGARQLEGDTRRKNSYSLAADASLQLLHKCLEWDEAQLWNLPPFHLYMITVAASFFVDAVKELGDMGDDSVPLDAVDGQSILPEFQAKLKDQALPAIRDMSVRLSRSSLHHKHVVKLTAANLHQYAKTLEASCRP